MNKMNRTKMNDITASTLSAAPTHRCYLALAAIALAALAIPNAGHAQGIVRGAQEGAYEGNRAAGPGWSAERSGPALGERLAPSTVCWGFPIGIAATATTIATAISTAIGDFS